jgi:hypothetical protein
VTGSTRVLLHVNLIGLINFKGHLLKGPTEFFSASLSLAKQYFLSHSLPKKILPDLSSDLHFPGFHNGSFLQSKVRQPCVQPPTWSTRSLYLCSPGTIYILRALEHALI